jgi:hypothetical protein
MAAAAAASSSPWESGRRCDSGTPLVDLVVDTIVSVTTKEGTTTTTTTSTHRTP